MEKNMVLRSLLEEINRFKGLSVFLETEADRRAAAEKADALQTAFDIIDTLAYPLPAETKLPELPKPAACPGNGGE